MADETKLRELALACVDAYAEAMRLATGPACDLSGLPAVEDTHKALFATITAQDVLALLDRLEDERRRCRALLAQRDELAHAVRKAVIAVAYASERDPMLDEAYGELAAARASMQGWERQEAADAGR